MSAAATKPTVFEHEHGAPASVAGSLAIFAVLAVLTFIALAIGFADLGAGKIYASLTVSLVASLVLTYFSMELKKADTLTWLIAIASVFWTFLLFLFTLTDYLTRAAYMH